MNQEISSILLLVIIGFAIYCLCNTKSVSGMTNVAPYQEEESEALITDTEPVMDEKEPIVNESVTMESETLPPQKALFLKH